MYPVVIWSKILNQLNVTVGGATHLNGTKVQIRVKLQLTKTKTFKN